MAANNIEKTNIIFGSFRPAPQPFNFAKVPLLPQVPHIFDPTKLPQLPQAGDTKLPPLNLFEGGTSLQGYLDIDLDFIDVVGRLYRLCDDEKIFDDGYESNFNIEGMYKGELFDLYDRWGDHQIHIGGTSKLDIEGFKTELTALIERTQPKQMSPKVLRLLDRPPCE